jgi:carbon storage regulator CsrA
MKPRNKAEVEDEAVFRIGPDITVKILKVNKAGDKVFVGIYAPPDVAIFRETLYKKVLEQRLKSEK